MIIITFFFLLLSFSSFANRSIETVCISPKLKLLDIDELKLVSNQQTGGNIQIDYLDGSSEMLRPIQRKFGIFNQYESDSTVSAGNGLLYTKSSKLGELFLKHSCYLNESIPYRHCGSRFVRIAPEAAVLLNIDGNSVIKLTGTDNCKRAEI